MELPNWNMPVKMAVPKSHDVAAVVPQAEQLNGVMAFSVRSIGQENPGQDSLNFMRSRNAYGMEINGNLDKLGTRLEIDARHIFTCNQIHGDDIAIVNTFGDGTPKADAIITENPGIFPAIKTADCLPILILESQKRIAAAVHAGWRGTVLRITRKVLMTLKSRYGCRPSDMIVALGPAIGPCCYEVDDKVLTPLAKAIPQADRFVGVKQRVQAVKGTSATSYRLDLRAVNRYELMMEGVPGKNIFELGLCTSCNPRLFFSYRRDGALCGRHIAITGFRK